MKALFIVIDLALNYYVFIVLAAVIMSWLTSFNVVNPRNQFVQMVWQFLYNLTEPLLKPIRRFLGRFLPPLGGIDISPIVLLLCIWFVRLVIGLYIIPNVP